MVPVIKAEPESTELERGLAHALNCVSAENGSNTPDFVLATFLSGCLDAFNAASKRREKWYGVELSIGSNTISIPCRDPSERAIGIAARIWCDKDMSSVVMDPDACQTIAKIIEAVIESQEPQASEPFILGPPE